jgi:hypothetical protein
MTEASALVRRLAFVASLPMLTVLAGCSAGVEKVGGTNEGLQTTPGVDYSFTRPAPDTLASDGYQFAARYLADDVGKRLTLSEAQALEAAGLAVVVVWEDGAQDALSGASLGASQAQTAEEQATAAGMPAGRPIYFAVDFDPTPSQLAALADYFDGVASVIGLDRTGAYGGYGTIKSLFDAGKITWGWQTYAWSSGQWDSRAQLRQTQNGIDNGDLDADEGMVADFGQWGANPQGNPPPTQTCSANGVEGTCMDVSQCSAMTGFVSTPGSCPGASNIQCCTQSAAPPPPPPPPPMTTSCTANGVDGTCLDTATCASMTGYVSTPGLCPGSSNVECCTPPPSCSVNGTAGVCISTTLCASMGHVSTAGFCPGAASEQCCTAQ